MVALATDQRVEEMTLWAWVGEDELGSGEMGIKQHLMPCGLTPLVSCKRDRMAQGICCAAMQIQAQLGGKTIRLVRFKFEAIELVMEPGQIP